MNIGLWVQGTRPRTLPASIAPVVVGAAVAWRRIGEFDICPLVYPQPESCRVGRALQTMLEGRFWPVAVLCALVALFLQIAVNFANDYSDGVRGTDDRRGDAETTSGKPRRMVASGLVPARHVLIAAGLAAALACIAGLAAVLVSHAWWLLAVGAASLVAGWCYTGGRHPYGYIGLGELGVFLFFGLVATLGTEYALAGTVDTTGVLAACCVGLNAVMILMVNNLRDIDDDRIHGKRTLAVRLGERGARAAFVCCLVVDWAGSVMLMPLLWFPAGLVPWLAVAAVQTCMIRAVMRRDFGGALGLAGAQTSAFAVCVAVAMAMDAVVS
ncbi:1,4-dihydroxy-2-naphthoate octaprenyltransferase [Bifidobacterium catulorum]|uniref:1,4-dihydroxy-2-naphthoate octaprenyltransferase n=1 Tax=Bifidobacterium catulorum TaxID=1630173 RepID=A0A2U2MUS9_9BIFI|nr:1,4-dihydroxy-2-naphthoate octaprenyltransferase [Bifidobacterium catulorum]PWG60609.1 1,4-dihydroxy-2-naphthoate octaprenyltransferase [Bifidobacterium catulorum]